MKRKGWIYLVISGTGGKVLGRYKAGDIFKYDDRVDRLAYFEITGKTHLWDESQSFDYGTNPYVNNEPDYSNWESCGLDEDEPQKYAIEIKDFEPREAFEQKELKVTHFPKWIDVMEHENPPCWYYSTDEAFVSRTPQSFQYVLDLFSGEKAILMPIHKKWFDMIAAGKKTWEFRNRVPKDWVKAV